LKGASVDSHRNCDGFAHSGSGRGQKFRRRGEKQLRTTRQPLNKSRAPLHGLSPFKGSLAERDRSGGSRVFASAKGLN